VKILWSAAAQGDLGRLYTFLARHDLDLADRVLDTLVGAPERLLEFPRRGSRLSEFDPRQVHEIRVGNYLLRYELKGNDILVLRLFHAREDRF
jgi:plasmid stabilization system protein ParE